MRRLSIYATGTTERPIPDDGRARTLHHVERRRAPGHQPDGLSGHFSIELDYTRTLSTPSVDRGAADPSAAGTSIFTALPEQLGLKLESTKAPLDVVVIDAIDRPTAN